jgi:hypothetical protein
VTSDWLHDSSSFTSRIQCYLVTQNLGTQGKAPMWPQQVRHFEHQTGTQVDEEYSEPRLSSEHRRLPPSRHGLTEANVSQLERGWEEGDPPSVKRLRQSAVAAYISSESSLTNISTLPPENDPQGSITVPLPTTFQGQIHRSSSSLHVPISRWVYKCPLSSLLLRHRT